MMENLTVVDVLLVEDDPGDVVLRSTSSTAATRTPRRRGRTSSCWT
jgi:hypothetical protein